MKKKKAVMQLNESKGRYKRKFGKGNDVIILQYHKKGKEKKHILGFKQLRGRQRTLSESCNSQ